MMTLAQRKALRDRLRSANELAALRVTTLRGELKSLRNRRHELKPRVPRRERNPAPG